LGKAAVGSAVIQLAEGLVDLTEQHSAAEQVRVKLTEDEIPRDDGASKSLGRLADGLVHDLELRAKLAGVPGTSTARSTCSQNLPAGPAAAVIVP